MVALVGEVRSKSASSSCENYRAETLHKMYMARSASAPVLTDAGPRHDDMLEPKGRQGFRGADIDAVCGFTARWLTQATAD